MKRNKKVLVIYLLLTPLLCFSCSTRSITSEEKELLLQVKDLWQFDVKTKNPQSAEKFKFTNYGFGAWEVEYEYDSSELPDVTPLYLTTKVEFETDEKEAIVTFKQGLMAYKAGGAIGGMKLIEKSDLFQWGNQSYSAVCEIDDQPIGNLIVVRKANKIYNFMVSGIYFDKTEDIEELLIPKLEKMMAFNQKDL